MTKKNCIVYRSSSSDECFWTGSGWSAEYPDASLYFKTEAIRIARKLKREQKLIGCDVVRNYGQDDAEVWFFF